MTQQIELGLDSCGDITANADGGLKSHAEVIRDVIEEGILADQVGVDAIGLGGHHRPDFAISEPDVVLSAIAARTKRIWLGSGLSVPSSRRPVRVVSRVSTVNH